jgi:hypothetical protein
MASIAKRPDGQYRGRYRDEAGKEHSRHFGRKVDAQAWLDQVTAAVVTGQYVDPKAGRITFTDFYGQWSDRQVWVAGTRRSMDMTAGSVTFGPVPLRSLRRSHVEGWVKSMSSRGLAASTITTRFNNVRAILRGAVADRVMPTDPSAGIRHHASAPPPPRGCHDTPVGRRSQEGARVSRRQLPGLRRTVRLRRTPTERGCRRPGGRHRLPPQDPERVETGPAGPRRLRDPRPKYGSERQVFLAPSLVSMISEHLANSTPEGDPARWLFTGEGVDPPPPNTVDHRWRMVRKRAGVRPIRLHDMRHFYASGLIAAGCDVVTVQRALGHASATTTLNTYSHLWPTAEDRARSAAEGLVRETLDATRGLGADFQQPAAR